MIIDKTVKVSSRMCAIAFFAAMAGCAHMGADGGRD